MYKKGVLFVNDSYNASLLSVKAALHTLPKRQNNRKTIAILGEMLELGKFSAQCHQEVGEYALDHVDHLICLGKGCEPICRLWNQAGRPAQLFNDRNEVVKTLKSIAQPNDVVLLKGSKSFELWKVLEDF